MRTLSTYISLDLKQHKIKNKSYAKKKVKNQRKNLMTKFHFDSTKDSKELALCSNAYDDVTDFKICGPFKNAKI